jgi:hypothetical protein
LYVCLSLQVTVQEQLILICVSSGSIAGFFVVMRTALDEGAIVMKYQLRVMVRNLSNPQVQDKEALLALTTSTLRAGRLSSAGSEMAQDAAQSIMPIHKHPLYCERSC